MTAAGRVSAAAGLGAVAADVLRADVPVDVGRDEARDAAARELADPAYRAAEPNLVERALRWLADRFLDLLDAASLASPVGVGGLVIALVLLVLAVVLIRLRVGPLARSGRAAGAVFDDHRPRTAAEHRAAADEAAVRGDLDDAVRHRVRAIVRGLEERGVLDERPGRTADEAAADAGARLPAHATSLREVARIFDDTVYGGRRATREAHEHVVAVDRAVQAARPSLADVAAGPVAAPPS